MPIRNGDYEPRDEDVIFSTASSSLLSLNSDANPGNESTLIYALLFSLSETLAENQELSLREVYRSAYVVDATGIELTKKARNLGVIRRPAQTATGVVTFSRDTNATTDYTIPSGTLVETLESDPVTFETEESVTLSSGTKSVDATVRAVEGGSDGNVGSGAITVMPSPPTGVEDVTNSDPTGDPTVDDTSGDPLEVGRNRETDFELRTRILDTDATDIGPTADGTELAVSQVDDVLSVHVETNQEDTAVNGIDAYHTEVTVLGGELIEIAQTLYDVMSITTLFRLQGGVNGTKESTSIYSDIVDQNITIPITRPVEVTADITIDVVHDGTYAGDVDVKDTIIEYTGGIRADDSSTTGLGLGENVLINEVENRVEDVQGVDFADLTLIDTNGDTNDDRTTDSDGVPVLSIGDSEVTRFDADAITVNTTAR
jgi:uncharacterized phage protein gp47/JayE